MNASLTAFYGTAFPPLGDRGISAIDLSGWESLMNDLAKKMHAGDLKPADISKKFVLNTYKELYKGTKSGYGKEWAKFTPDANGKTVNSLKKNLFLFSGAKTYTMQVEMNKLLQKDGKVRDFEDFKKEALKLNSKYNKNYLQAEYQTARQTGHHVRNWQGYQKNKDLFPNLKYKTAGDARVRESHRALNNVVKPIDDPFWNSFYPPNGWRCFEPDTSILTQTGWKNIKNVQRTDYLVGGSGNMRFVGDVITSDFNGNLVTILSKREKVSCTPNHRFMTSRGWIVSEDIEIGDILVQVGKTGFKNKISNAVRNTITLFTYSLMSFKRKWESVRTLNVQQ